MGTTHFNGVHIYSGAPPNDDIGSGNLVVDGTIVQKGNGYTVAGTYAYTPPTGTSRIKVQLIGAGGGGGGGFTATHVGGAGAPGGMVTAVLNVAGNTPFTIVVGAAGTGGAVTVDGVNGGATTIVDANSVNTLSAGGGGLGHKGVVGADGAAGAAATNSATADAVVAPIVISSVVTAGAIGGAGGAINGAGGNGGVGFVIVEAY